jgi:hypothetical protein
MRHCQRLLLPLFLILLLGCLIIGNRSACAQGVTGVNSVPGSNLFIGAGGSPTPYVTIGTNGNVGIDVGTTPAITPFEVNGTSYFAGNVGVGTPGPAGEFEVINSGNWGNAEYSGNGIQTSTGHTPNVDWTLYMGADSIDGLAYIQSVKWGCCTGNLVLNARGGNVGINKINPQESLDVNGSIYDNSMITINGNWSPGQILNINSNQIWKSNGSTGDTNLYLNYSTAAPAAQGGLGLNSTVVVDATGGGWTNLNIMNGSLCINGQCTATLPGSFTVTTVSEVGSGTLGWYKFCTLNGTGCFGNCWQQVSTSGSPNAQGQYLWTWQNLGQINGMTIACLN